MHDILQSASDGRGQSVFIEGTAGMCASTVAPNREIAGKLFVTQRTVELHLSRVYRKLSVPGRAGLAEYFADLPDNGPRTVPDGTWPVPSGGAEDRAAV